MNLARFCVRERISVPVRREVALAVGVLGALLAVVATSVSGAELPAAPTASPTGSEKYVVAAKIPLDLRWGGVDGSLVLLRDPRVGNVSGPGESDQGASGDGDSAVGGQQDDDRSARSDAAALNAELRIVDAQGRLLAAHPLDAPRVGLKPIQLYDSAKPTYEVDSDDSSDFGSYSGWSSTFFQVQDGRFLWLSASSSKKKPEKIVVAKTGKEDWKIVTAADGRGRDILSVRCRPAPGKSTRKQRFLLTLRRFHFDGKKWILRERSEPGFWEEGDEFPAIERFP